MIIGPEARLWDVGKFNEIVNLKIYRSSAVIRIMLQKPEACGEKIGCQFCQSFLSHQKM